MKRINEVAGNNTTDLTENKDERVKVKHPITNGIEPYGKLADGDEFEVNEDFYKETKKSIEAFMKEEAKKAHIPYAVHAWEKHYPDILRFARDLHL